MTENLIGELNGVRSVDEVSVRNLDTAERPATARPGGGRGRRSETRPSSSDPNLVGNFAVRHHVGIVGDSLPTSAFAAESDVYL